MFQDFALAVVTMRLARDEHEEKEPLRRAPTDKRPRLFVECPGPGQQTTLRVATQLKDDDANSYKAGCY